VGRSGGPEDAEVLKTGFRPRLQENR